MLLCVEVQWLSHMTCTGTYELTALDALTYQSSKTYDMHHLAVDDLEADHLNSRRCTVGLHFGRWLAYLSMARTVEVTR